MKQLDPGVNTIKENLVLEKSISLKCIESVFQYYKRKFSLRKVN